MSELLRDATNGSMLPPLPLHPLPLHPLPVHPLPRTAPQPNNLLATPLPPDAASFGSSRLTPWLCCFTRCCEAISESYNRSSLPLLLPARVTHPSSHQVTPLGVHRVRLLFFYMIYNLIGTYHYINWCSFSSWLQYSGAYSYLCNSSEPSCDAQKLEIQKLFSFCTFGDCFGAILGGVLLDTWGMRATALTGMSLQASGWCLLAFSGSSFDAYKPAFVLIGLGLSAAYLAPMGVFNLFPGAVGLVVSLLQTAATTSAAIPLLLSALARLLGPDSFRWICLGYLGCGPLACCCISVLLMPPRAFTGIDVVEQEHWVAAKAKDAEDTAEFAACDIVEVAPACVLNGVGEESSISHRRRCCWSAARRRGLAWISRTGFFDKSLYLEIFRRPHFLCIFMFNGIMLACCGFYQEAGPDLILRNASAETVFVCLFTVSMVPLLGFGQLIDSFGVLSALSVHSFIAFATFAVVLPTFYEISSPGKIVTNTISVICFFCAFTVAVDGLIVCFVQHYAPSRYFGKILGFSNSFAGCLCLLAMPLYDQLTVRYFKNDALPVSAALTVILAALCAICLLSYWNASTHDRKLLLCVGRRRTEDEEEVEEGRDHEVDEEDGHVGDKKPLEAGVG
eukprot:GHVS01029079.1.p1 GENE.GHVS01029079.1~~GHVS01029079.1.p1  ORF type:complete len:621 (-),score=81.69 GHVS01029079.1:318-2180(-)